MTAAILCLGNAVFLGVVFHVERREIDRADHQGRKPAVAGDVRDHRAGEREQGAITQQAPGGEPMSLMSGLIWLLLHHQLLVWHLRLLISKWLQYRPPKKMRSLFPILVRIFYW